MKNGMFFQKDQPAMIMSQSFTEQDRLFMCAFCFSLLEEMLKKPIGTVNSVWFAKVGEEVMELFSQAMLCLLKNHRDQRNSKNDFLNEAELISHLKTFRNRKAKK